MAEDPDAELIYNGACPVCDAGVEAFRDTRPGMAYVDITNEPAVLEKYGLSALDVQYRVHAITSEGALIRGIDAVAVLLVKKRGWRLIGRILKLPPFRQVGWLAYETAAFILFRWNKWRGNF